MFDWKEIFLIVMVCLTIAFTVERCTSMSVEIAKEKSNTSRDYSIGIGKK